MGKLTDLHRGPLSSNELIELTGEDRWNIRIVLDELRDEGKVIRQGDKQWSRYVWIKEWKG